MYSTFSLIVISNMRAQGHCHMTVLLDDYGGVAGVIGPEDQIYTYMPCRLSPTPAACVGGEVSVNPRSNDRRSYRALYDYFPRQDSPNPDPENELFLRAGDYLIIIGQVQTDGFFLAEKTSAKGLKRIGLVPSNFVAPEPAPQSYTNAMSPEVPSLSSTKAVNSTRHDLSGQVRYPAALPAADPLRVV